MDLFERLVAANEAAKRGDYQHALSEFLWFHNHVLEEDEAFRGVRLSFVLESWAKLAADYPPAMDALRDVRSRAAARLLGGEADEYALDDFHDVVAIDEQLDQPRSTYDLLLELRASRPGLDMTWGNLAWEVAAKAGDFALAREYVPYPESVLDTLLHVINYDEPAFDSEEERDPDVEGVSTRFGGSAARLLEVLVQTGATREAVRLRSRFLEEIRDPLVRDRIREILAPAV